MYKIVQINVSCNWGSTGRIAEDIGKLVLDEGWESYIAFGRYELESESVKIRIGSKYDFYKHAFMSRIIDRTGFYSLDATREFIKKLDHIKPDIIHLHNIHGYYIHIGLLFEYIAKHKIPVVWTLHDCWAFTGHCSYFDYIGCNKWMKQCFKCPQKKSYPASYFMDNSKQNYCDKKNLFNSLDNLTLVPVSLWLSDLVRKSFLRSNLIRSIYNGIDVNTFRPIDSNLKDTYKLTDKIVLLGVASTWSDRKGLRDFIELSKRLPENYIIVLIGITDRIKKNLPSNILGISRTNSITELAEWYSLADIFVNPTWEDNFPTTNLEALACGTPVITYRTGGSVEAVNQHTGLCVDKGNINQLHEAIKKIICRGKSYYTDACRKRAVESFNKQDRYMDYIQLYKNILSK